MDEIWKDVVGFEGLYEVSSLGRIKFLPKKKWAGKSFYITKESISFGNKIKTGYYYVCLIKNESKKYFRVNRLVATAFIQNPLNKRCVNHVNGIKTDNRVGNLEWSTHSENSIHAFKIGLKNNYHLRKLSDDEVKYIRKNLNITNTKMAKKFNVDQALIIRIRSFKERKNA